MDHWEYLGMPGNSAQHGCKKRQNSPQERFWTDFESILKDFFKVLGFILAPMHQAHGSLFELAHYMFFDGLAFALFKRLVFVALCFCSWPVLWHLLIFPWLYIFFLAGSPPTAHFWCIVLRGTFWFLHDFTWFQYDFICFHMVLHGFIWFSCDFTLFLYDFILFLYDFWGCGRILRMTRFFEF